MRTFVILASLAAVGALIAKWLLPNIRYVWNPENSTYTDRSTGLTYATGSPDAEDVTDLMVDLGLHPPLET